jgi:type III secretion system FlhB-like substrate exporter
VAGNVGRILHHLDAGEHIPEELVMWIVDVHGVFLMTVDP